MFDLAIVSRFARDRTAQQFAEPRSPSRSRAPASVPETAVAPRAPVRRTGARFLRTLADRIEPAPRCAPQG